MNGRKIFEVTKWVLNGDGIMGHRRKRRNRKSNKGERKYRKATVKQR